MSKQQITISAAAKLVNKSPKTLYAAIKTGKLSVTTDTEGQKVVAISELIRAYGEINQEPQAPSQQAVNNELLALQHKLELLALENENLKQRLDDKEKNLEDLRQTTKLLEHQQTKEKGFLSRLFNA
jgi:predicted nuclease with TOPRIM domain